MMLKYTSETTTRHRVTLTESDIYNMLNQDNTGEIMLANGDILELCIVGC